MKFFGNSVILFDLANSWQGFFCDSEGGGVTIWLICGHLREKNHHLWGMCSRIYGDNGLNTNVLCGRGMPRPYRRVLSIGGITALAGVFLELGLKKKCGKAMMLCHTLVWLCVCWA